MILAGANSLSDLGEAFAANVYEAELRYLVENEWVVELDDAIWRRTKLGMWLNDAEKQHIAQWLAEHTKVAVTA